MEGDKWTQSRYKVTVIDYTCIEMYKLFVQDLDLNTVVYSWQSRRKL